VSDLVRYKRPAEVVRARPVFPLPQRVETLVGSKDRILAEVARLKRDRTLADTGQLTEIKYGPEMGRYELKVVLIDRPAAPRWARVCVGVGSVLLGLAAVLGSLAWVLSALTLPALAMFLGTVLAVFVAWLKVAHGGGRTRGVTVTTSTTVTWR
jgi:hypothetical protein